MFPWLRRMLGLAEVRSLPIEIEMEEDASGTCSIRVYATRADGRHLIADPASLDYGYTEEVRRDADRVIYRLDPSDAEMLAALRSLNPRQEKEGVLKTEVLPPQLRHLRQRSNVYQGPNMQSVTIVEGAKTPTMQIAFDEAKGLDVHFGYQDQRTGTLEGIKRVVHANDGFYARAGQMYIPLPDDFKEKQRHLLEAGHFNVNLDRLPRFFLRDLVLYQQRFNAVLVGDAAQVEVIESSDVASRPVIALDASVPGWLDFEVNYEASGQTIPHAQLLEAARSNQFYRISAKSWLKLDKELLEATDQALISLGAQPDSEGETYRIASHQFADLEAFIIAIGGNRVASDAYQSFLAQLTGFKSSKAFRLSESMENQFMGAGIALRDYQRAGIHWLDWLSCHHLHGLLADDMGLGKTVQSIAAIGLAYDRTPEARHSLVLAPRSVLPHWEREIKRCLPGLQVCRYHGIQRHPIMLQAQRPTVFLTTYSTAANDIEHLVRVPFFYLVLDEATYIKTPSTKRTKAAKRVNAAHRLALSGTPVENRPAELWSIFDFLMPGHLGRYGTFTREFEDAILEGSKEVTERLGERIRPFMMRRTKEEDEIRKDLPDKIRMREYCELTREQRQLYGGLQDQVRRVQTDLAHDANVNATSILPILTKLKQICDHPAIVNGVENPLMRRSEKFDLILEKVASILEQRQQVVIFSHFLGMLDLLERWLRRQGIDHIRIDGSTRYRQIQIDRFDDEAVPVALCSLKAAGMGLNLQSANHVIHADRWWNPAIEDQATDRVHRIGQERTVYVHYVIIEGTLEERIDALLEKKREIADDIIEAAKQGIAGWTREELLEILQPFDA